MNAAQTVAREATCVYIKWRMRVSICVSMSMAAEGASFGGQALPMADGKMGGVLYYLGMAEYRRRRLAA